MKERYMVIDVAQCENCNNCFLACKDEHAGNMWPGYTAPQPDMGSSWVRIEGKERGSYPLIDVAYLPVHCMHCDDAPCIKAARDGAVYRRPDGIVMIDALKAKGQKQIVPACPYHAIMWNEDEQVPQKCTLCAHLLDRGWNKTRCVQSCPTAAVTLHLMEPAEMETYAAVHGLQVLIPEKKTRPRVYYSHLYRYTHSFIGGSVVTSIRGREECVEGAEVILLAEGKGAQASQFTDAFGDFRFDGLTTGSGIYRVRVIHESRETTGAPVDLKESVSLGVIRV